MSETWSDRGNAEEIHTVLQAILGHSAYIREIYATVRTEETYTTRDAANEAIKEVDSAFSNRDLATKQRNDKGLPEYMPVEAAVEQEGKRAYHMVMNIHPIWFLPFLPMVAVAYEEYDKIPKGTLDPLQEKEEVAKRAFKEVMERHPAWLHQKFWTGKGAAMYYEETARCRFLTASRA